MKTQKRGSREKTGDELLDPGISSSAMSPTCPSAGRIRLAGWRWASDDDHVRHFHYMKVVGQIDAYGQDAANPVFDEELMENAAKLGNGWQRQSEKPYEEVSGVVWRGGGVCPVCHGKAMMMGSGTQVYCATCR